jgi:phosphate transport system protein
MMASLTERNLNYAIEGLLQRDDDLCARAIADDSEIDELEKQIDKDGIDVLLRFQPVASDLRRVVSAIKLNSNGARSRSGSKHRPSRAQVERSPAAAAD